MIPKDLDQHLAHSKLHLRVCNIKELVMLKQKKHISDSGNLGLRDRGWQTLHR